MEIYILPNGQEVDLTGYPENEIVIWLSDNPGATKKAGGDAAGASAAPQNNMFAPQENTGLVSETSSLEFPENDQQDLYGLPENIIESTNATKAGLGSYFNKYNDEDLLATDKFSNSNQAIFEDDNIQAAVDNNFITEDDLIIAGYQESPEAISVLNFISDDEKQKARRKISTFQSKDKKEITSYIDLQQLNEPYIYEKDYVAENQTSELDKQSMSLYSPELAEMMDFEDGLSFVDEMYNNEELSSRNINTKDFGGFLQAKGYDKDLKRFLELDMDKRNYGKYYEPQLALEAKKLQYLNLYINDQVQRDIKQQQLMYEMETGIDPKSIDKKFNISNENVLLQDYENLIKTEFPLIANKLEKQDEKNTIEYQNMISNGGNIGAGRFLLNIAGNGLNGLGQAIENFSNTVYGALPGDFFEGVAESGRTELALEEMGVVNTRFNSFGRYVNARGYEYTDPKTKIRYVVDANNQIIDATNELNATPFLTAQQQDDIRQKARKGNRKGTSFSTLGAFDAGANVIGDLFFQIALQRGMGNGIKAVGGVTKGFGILGKTKDFLRSVPIKRNMAEAIIGQSTLGFSRGYEETLKQARQAGVNDDDARELAFIASIQTGILYAATAPLNPRTRAADALFGKVKNEFVKEALEKYAQKGVQGFRQSLASKGRTLFNLGGEGLKEVFQENVQQVGETFAVNKNTNESAERKIMKDTMSLQDFLDTTILSFFAGAIMPGAGVAVRGVKKTARQLLGMSSVDRFNNLSYLAYKKKETLELLASQVDQGIYTQEEADQIIEELTVFNDNINRMPTDISAEAAEEILGDVNEVGKLRNQRKTEDKSFNATTDERIKKLDEKIQRVYYNDLTARQSGVIAAAIKKGLISNIEWKEFNSSQEIKDYLVNELNYTPEKASFNSEQYGNIIEIDGKQYVIINNDKSAKDGRIGVKQHEFLHGLIFQTIKNDPEAQILLGKSLLSEVLKIQDRLSNNDSKLTALPAKFLNDFTSYIKYYGEQTAKIDADLASDSITKIEHANKLSQLQGKQWEEVLTLYSEAIDVGAVTYDEDTFTKLKDVIRQVLQFLGVKDITFGSGRDVYNFIKDYNKSMKSRTMALDKNKAFKKLGTEGAKVDKESLKKDISKTTSEIGKPVSKPKPKTTEDSSEEDNYTFNEKFALKPESRSTNEEFKNKINSFYNKNKWGKISPDDRVFYDIIEQYEKPILQKAYVLYGNLPDYSAEDMIQETQIALIPHIRNFNKKFLQLREAKRKQLEDDNMPSNSINNELNILDEKGYKDANGDLVTENNNLNGWINSQLRNKMKAALKTGSVTSQQFTDEIDDRIAGSTLDTDNDILEQEKQSYEQSQDELTELLRDPVFGFVNSDGKPIEIDGVPIGGDFAIDSNDPSIAVNRRLATVSDPSEKAQLEKQKRDLKRGLELEAKESLTNAEVKELKELKSFKTYSLSSGGMIKTYEAYSEQINPAQVIIAEVKRQILSSRNIENLDFRAFKEKLAILSQTLSRRMTFQNSSSLEAFMFSNWKLIFDVINNPIDPVTGESTYAIKKLPPRLKDSDDNGKPKKIKNLNVATFLQNYFGLEEATRIIEKLAKNNKERLLNSFDPAEQGRTGKNLWATAYFDRRTALMELFGDVLVLQEARNAIRDDAFLKEISKRNVDLYNDLKDTNIRNKVLNNLARGKSPSVKFSLNTKANLKFSKNPKNGNILSSFTVNGKKYILSFLNTVQDVDVITAQRMDEDSSRVLSDKEYKFAKKLASQTYEVIFSQMVGVEFIRDGEVVEGKIPSTEITGTGDAFAVMSIVANGMQQAIDKFNIKNLLFDSEESSRSRLYTRLIRMLASKAGFKLSTGSNSMLTDTGKTFMLSKQDYKSLTRELAKEAITEQQERSEMFSLDNGSLNNAKGSDYLSSTPNVESQLFMAQTIDDATRETIKFNKKAKKFNVPDLGNMNDKAISYYLIDKISQGYNDFYFKNNDNWKGKMSKNVLDTGDVKFSLNNERNKYNSNLSKGLNEIIEENFNINADEVFSRGRANELGKIVGGNNVWLPPADSDFLGLMYMIASAKGKKGETQIKWLNDNLIKPYSEGMLNMVEAKNVAHRDFKNLMKQNPRMKKLLMEDSGYSGFSMDTALRVYLWKRNGMIIPDLDVKDTMFLSNIIRKNPVLKTFALKLEKLSKMKNNWIEPSATWQSGNILSDIQDILNFSNREKFLARWIQNKDLIFDKDNLNKLQASLGFEFRDSLENILKRMQTGKNKPQDYNAFVDWLNGSVGVTMFFNMRSALLQTISATNFINTTDNNVLAAAGALANQTQFWKDFTTLWNSAYLSNRREGMLSDLQEAELMDVVSDPRYKGPMAKTKAAIAWILKKGFMPTRFADSFAIALGGSSFYRNRIKSLMKQGLELKVAESQAMREFYEVAETSQQSADPSKISKNQASVQGRLILAFQNTPLQYGRIIKNSVVDLVKGRGNWKNNVANITYYGALQNLVFNFLQNALFGMWFDDDEYADEKGKYDKGKYRAVNGAMDTLLRGSGLKGAIFAGIKNTILKAIELNADPKGRYKSGKLLVEALNVSPPVGIKARKLMKGWEAIQYNKQEAEYLGWSLDNKYYLQSGASITSAALNIPLDRLYIKSENVKDAMNSEYENWQRIALMMGYTKWNLGLEDEEGSNDSGGLNFKNLDFGGSLEFNKIKF